MQPDRRSGCLEFSAIHNKAGRLPHLSATGSQVHRKGSVREPAVLWGMRRLGFVYEVAFSNEGLLEAFTGRGLFIMASGTSDLGQNHTAAFVLVVGFTEKPLSIPPYSDGTCSSTQWCPMH
jgi:hypothetical protein